MSTNPSVWAQEWPVILASKSQIRRELLERAGLSPMVIVPEFDERAFEATLQREALALSDRAQALANEKARLVSLANPSRYVIGADQMLMADATIVHKPNHLTEAKQQLAFLSGKTHRLISAVSVARDGHILFSHADSADMTMRVLTATHIEHYCALVGDHVLQTVGCYELEGLGIHLFTHVEGGFFTILGLPLQPLIQFFREEGCLIL